MQELNISNVRNKIEERENQLKYYCEYKLMLKLSVQPKSKELKGVMVSGSKVNQDVLVNYVDKLNEVDEMIEFLNSEIRRLLDFETAELKRLDKYNDMEKKIYSLRYDMEYQKTHNGKPREWWKIAQAVHLSERQCRRIIKGITGQRDN